MSEAKEKAKELYNKFIVYTPLEVEHSASIDCALIAVDELISNCFEQHHWEYWNEVRKELEAMK